MLRLMDWLGVVEALPAGRCRMGRGSLEDPAEPCAVGI